MTSQLCVNSGKNGLCTETMRLYPCKGFLLCFNNNFSKFIKRNSKIGVKFAVLSSNLRSTVLVQKQTFGGIKTHESDISPEFPQLFIFENETCLVNFFRNTNADRDILRESLAAKAIIEKLCYCVFAHFAVFRPCYSVDGAGFALNYPGRRGTAQCMYGVVLRKINRIHQTK